MPRTAPASRLTSVLSLRSAPPSAIDEVVDAEGDDRSSMAGPPTVPLPVGQLAAWRRRWPGRSDGARARAVRLDPGRPAAMALVLVAALAAVVAAIGVWTARPQAEPVRGLPEVAVGAGAAGSCGAPPDAEGAGGTGAGGAAGAGGGACDGARAGGSGSASAAGAAGGSGSAGAAGAAGGSPGVLVVSVAGRVARPGVVRLPDGARVADALAAAGGVRAGVDLSGLNLARRLVDGEQIAVGVPPAPDAAGQPPPGASGGSAAGAGGGPAAKIDLNTASVAQLDGLPGVGPVTAQHIVEWRGRNGRFARVDQLREIDGIGERRFQQLRELVTV